MNKKTKMKKKKDDAVAAAEEHGRAPSPERRERRTAGNARQYQLGLRPKFSLAGGDLVKPEAAANFTRPISK